MPILVIFKSVWTFGIMLFNSNWTICQFYQALSQLHFVLSSTFLPFANREDLHIKMNLKNSFFSSTIISGEILENRHPRTEQAFSRPHLVQMDRSLGRTLVQFLNTPSNRRFPSGRCRIGPHCPIGSSNSSLES